MNYSNPLDAVPDVSLETRLIITENQCEPAMNKIGTYKPAAYQLHQRSRTCKFLYFSTTQVEFLCYIFAYRLQIGLVKYLVTKMHTFATLFP